MAFLCNWISVSKSFPKKLTTFCYNKKVKILNIILPGEVVEWFKALVLKTRPPLQAE